MALRRDAREFGPRLAIERRRDALAGLRLRSVALAVALAAAAPPAQAQEGGFEHAMTLGWQALDAGDHSAAVTAFRTASELSTTPSDDAAAEFGEIYADYLNGTWSEGLFVLRRLDQVVRRYPLPIAQFLLHEAEKPADGAQTDALNAARAGEPLIDEIMRLSLGAAPAVGEPEALAPPAEDRLTALLELGGASLPAPAEPVLAPDVTAPAKPVAPVKPAAPAKPTASPEITGLARLSGSVTFRAGPGADTARLGYLNADSIVRRLGPEQVYTNLSRQQLLYAEVELITPEPASSPELTPGRVGWVWSKFLAAVDGAELSADEQAGALAALDAAPADPTPPALAPVEQDEPSPPPATPSIARQPSTGAAAARSPRLNCEALEQLRQSDGVRRTAPPPGLRVGEPVSVAETALLISERIVREGSCVRMRGEHAVGFVVVDAFTHEASGEIWVELQDGRGRAYFTEAENVEPPPPLQEGRAPSLDGARQASGAGFVSAGAAR